MINKGIKRILEPVLLILPGFAFLLLAFFFPALHMLSLSLLGENGLMGGLTLEHYGKLILDDFYLGVALRTFRLSLLITLICLLTGFPLAVVISRSKPKIRSLMILIVVLPLMTSVVIRTFGWLVILGPGGGLSWALENIGLIDRQISLMRRASSPELSLDNSMILNDKK